MNAVKSKKQAQAKSHTLFTRAWEAKARWAGMAAGPEKERAYNEYVSLLLKATAFAELNGLL